MAEIKKNTLKTQGELRQENITTYKVESYTSDKQPIPNLKKRELQKSVKNDESKRFSIGLRDIDEAIFYYFDNVIQPHIVTNGNNKKVPVLYASPERWKAVQSDGFYRDRHGKVQLPLILLRRDNIEKNRQLGNKLDANSPRNYGVFEKKYSVKNRYDRFAVLTNRKEVKEFQGVVIPDYVNITYSCLIFTQYIEQMNKLVESINYASDSYWGDTEKFSFRAMIDDYSMTTELVQGSDRTVRTEFTINLLGHLVPDSINTLPQGVSKYYSKSSVKITNETVTDINDIKT